MSLGECFEFVQNFDLEKAKSKQLNKYEHEHLGVISIFEFLLP